MARRVGILGIGIMGTAMMRNLVRDGFEVVGYDVSEGAMARLAEAGGVAATSPRDVAEKVEILITSLPSVDAFDQVMTGQGGIASSPGREILNETLAAGVTVRQTRAVSSAQATRRDHLLFKLNDLTDKSSCKVRKAVELSIPVTRPRCQDQYGIFGYYRREYESVSC